ncbi:hypothetical protein ACF1B0_03485 [Streptomyces anandii]|uniref:hypothetical protein n=1 Tax=Streptomyces anandii TaxID=285454 RepID=UPI0036FCF8BB
MAMEAGPRDTAADTERATVQRTGAGTDVGTSTGTGMGADKGQAADLNPGADLAAGRDAGPGTAGDPDEGTLSPDGPDEIPDGVTADGPAPEEMFPGPEVEVELRPQRRLRIWQLAPIVGLAAVGSLMFAFPLAFDGDSGAVIAMLGLLICLCAAGWGMMAARRVGSTWPGVPPRGSGRRPDWRMIGVYVLLGVLVVVLAVWRVARLR